MSYSGPKEQKCKYRRVPDFHLAHTSHTLSARILRKSKHNAFRRYLTGTEGEPWRQFLKLSDAKINITFNS
jgi:hypothetical protein